MRMYTLHFGQGREHTEHFFDQAKGNFPANIDSGFDSGAGAVPNVGSENTQITSHKEIFERYGVKGGHGDYCLEVYSSAGVSVKSNLAQLHVGGFGDLQGIPGDFRPFYLKVDFMYTNDAGGRVLSLQRTNSSDEFSDDLTLTLEDGFLKVQGATSHLTQPETGVISEAWIASHKDKQGTIFLAPNKWHEIQIFVNATQGWNGSFVGPLQLPGAITFVESFVTAFEAFESHDNGILFPFNTPSAETGFGVPNNPLKMDTWPSNGHPIFPNVMLPGQDQSVWPPENQASGQFFHGDELGLVYVWVNGKLDIQHATHMVNETTPFTMGGGISQQSVYLGGVGLRADQQGDRFFYDNIIMNDSRDPSGSLPSKIFNPLFSSDASLEWNPGYDLKFTAMIIDPDFHESDVLDSVNGRRSNAWMPTYPRGAMVPSGEQFFIPSPNRLGSSNDSMVPHGAKLTTIHLDWDGDQQDYTTVDGNRSFYPDYDINYAYQYLQPEESNAFEVNADDPHLISLASGNKALFYLKRPPAASGQEPFAGGPGLGGVKDYVPNINADIGESTLPAIYRIWTSIQGHGVGTTSPIDEQHHMIRVPSGVSGFVDFISDNHCPGDRGYRAYTQGSATVANGYSISEWPYNPVTNLPWTWNDLEVLQVGSYHATHAGSNQIELNTLYLVVEHANSVNTDIGILGTNLLEWAVADDIPYVLQEKNMYKAGWRQDAIGQPRSYFNRWDISPTFLIDRTDRQSQDGQAIVDTPQFSGVISFDYKVRYINGELAQPREKFIKYDEHFPQVWVYTVSGINPSSPRRFPFRGEVITDGAGNHFTFLTHPILQYNAQKFPTDNNLSPLSADPYIVYDENVMYVVPLTTHKIATLLDPDDIFGSWTDTNIVPATSGSFGAAWKIDKEENAFNFKFDPDSYFDTISPSSIANHKLTSPGDASDTTFPDSRSGHDEYFRAPNLASGSALQTIFLTDRLGVPESAIDNGLYQVYMGLYQTTANQAVNDTGEGKFEFFSGPMGVDTLISGHTFGQDGTAGWHLNDTTVALPSGTRQVLFTFDAIRNTTGPKSPGGTLGGTSNFAAFDEPFFIMSLSSGLPSKSIHPADVNQDSRILTAELASYIELWQDGTLPLGVAKDYLTKAEQIWQSGLSSVDPSGGLYGDSGGPKPENWVGSGVV